MLNKTSPMIAAWLKALRSGAYRQTTGTSYDETTDSYCALGLYEHVTRSSWRLSDPNNLPELAVDVLAWNDWLGYTFPEIADLIEKKYCTPPTVFITDSEQAPCGPTNNGGSSTTLHKSPVLGSGQDSGVTDTTNPWSSTKDSGSAQLARV